jgi:hypothetical protein
MNKTLTRFLKYFFIGSSTFILDLSILYILTDIFLINYLTSTAIAFIIAISINYYFSKNFVFTKTARKTDRGYYYFLVIAGTGLIFVMILMKFFVEILLLNYLLSRTIVSGIVGMWNYLINLYFNFKVNGNH